MITLAALAQLAADHADELATPVAPYDVDGRSFDTDAQPMLMGVVNLSQDSWYRESVVPSCEAAVRRGIVLAAQGADLVDVGAESVVEGSARVGAEQQITALVPVIEELTAAGVLVSVETYQPEVVRATLAAGARVLNLTGSAEDAAMFDLAAEYDAALVLCHVLGANPRALDDTAVQPDPFPEMLEQFEARVGDARSRGVRAGISVDPGVGFGFKQLVDPRQRTRYQATTLLNTFRLRRLGLPVCHALPSGFDYFEDEVRIAEGFFAVLASLGGTGIYRTHEVPRVRAVLSAMADLGVSAV